MRIAGCFAVAAVLAGSSPAGAAQELSLVHRSVLPEALRHAADVRFDGAEALVVSAWKLGAVRVPYSEEVVGNAQILVPETTDPDGIVIAEHLGLSRWFLVVSSPASLLHWSERGGGQRSGRLGTWGSPDRAPISFFEDVDLWENRLAVVGLMRSARGMSPDGAVAWVGEVGSSEVDLRPLAYSQAGQGARPFMACGGHMLGKIRFLRDGRVVLVPGAEAGVFLYSREGMLERTWDTAPLGLEPMCDFDDDTLVALAGSARNRLDHLNRFVTVDEILPISSTPGLLLRRVGPAGTVWDLVLLKADGKTERVRVPITSPSPKARLRGDVRDDRFVLILSHYVPDPGQERSEIIELRLQGAEGSEGSEGSERAARLRREMGE